MNDHRRHVLAHAAAVDEFGIPACINIQKVVLPFKPSKIRLLYL